MGSKPSLENAILADDLSALSALLATPLDATITPLGALALSARLSRPASFAHLISQYPTLIASFNTDSVLLDAVSGGSIPIWRIILEHRPDAKNQRFGHFGTVVERCVANGKSDLLKYLLAEGARVEQTGRPILIRAKVWLASEEIKETLAKYGAKTDFSEEELEEEGLKEH